MSRPVAYLRRSSPNRRNGHVGAVSFEMQTQAVHDLARRHGLRLADEDVLVDWGVSGREHAVGQRRAYADLMERITSGEASNVFAYSLSRLGRSVRTILDLTKACREAGVPIHLAKEGTVDDATPYGRMVLTILAAVAEMEAEVASERARDRTDAQRDAGAYVGRPPFGWVHAADGILVEHAEEAPIAARVRALYEEHGTYSEVVRILNDEAIPTPTVLRARREGREVADGERGRHWREGTVRRVVGRGDAPSSIEVRDRTRKGSRRVHVAPFVRLLRCAECQAMLTTTRTHYVTAGGEARTWTGYQCQGARQLRTHGRPFIVSEAAVLAWAKDEAARLRPVHPLTGEPLDAVEMRSASEAAIADLRVRRERLVEAVEAGVLDHHDVRARLEVIAAEEARVRADVDVIRIPAIDWTWPPERLGPALSALWRQVEVDIPTRTFIADWTVPEWRA